MAKNQCNLSPRLYMQFVGLIYTVAVGLRAWRYICGDMSSENAVMGKMARDWLFGEVPYFFYGQSHMGGWDTLLSAPLIALFGPSVWIINLWPPLISLGVMVICHRVMVRILPPAGVLAGLCYMAVPPAYWMFYTGYTQTHNSLCIMLEALLMLLTARFWEQDNPKLGLYIALGLVSGAGFYLNFQMGAAILPCAVFIVLFTWRKFKPLKVAATLAAAVLGLMPMIIFNMNAGGEHLGILSVFSWRYFGVGWQPFIGNAVPLILGFQRPPVQCQAGVIGPMWEAYAVLGAMLLAGMLALIWRGASKERRLAWLPVMLGLTNAAIVLFSSWGRVLSGFHQAYLFTLYLMLPFAWGAFCMLLANRRLTVPLVLSAGLMGLHAYNYNNFCVHGFRLISGPFHVSGYDARLRERLRELRSKGVKSVYTKPAPPLSYYAHRSPLVVNPYEEGKARDSFLADADSNPMFYGLAIEGSLEFMGLEYETVKLADKTGYWKFKLPKDAGRVVQAPEARATRLDGADLGRALTDRDVNTMFSTFGKAKDGQGFVLDLGREMDLAGFSLVPNKYNDSPSGLRVEAAGEDGRFSIIREMRGYWGPFYLSGPHPVLKARHARADCYFPANKVRYLRLTHMGASHAYWTVREMILYGPDGEGGAEPNWQESSAKALELIRQKGFSTVYADTWAAGPVKYNLPEVMTLGGNTGQDDYGHIYPPIDEDWMLKAGPDSAILSETKYSPNIMARLDQADIPAHKKALGALDLISLGKPRSGKPVPIVGITSNLNPAKAKALITPGRGRWTSGKRQEPGAYLELDLGAPKDVASLVLSSPDHPNDYPRGLAAELSLDGAVWQETKIRQTMPLCYNGQVLLTKPGPINRYRIETSQKTRFIRLRARGDGAGFWWSVQKVEVFSPKSPSTLGTPLRK